MDAAAADRADGWSGAWIWDHRIVTDDEIPRPAKPDRVWRQSVDVCHADHLPGLEHSGKMALGGGLEPGHANCRDFQGWFFGRRRRLLAAPGLQCGIHAGRTVYRGGDLQPRRKDLY